MLLLADLSWDIMGSLALIEEDSQDDSLTHILCFLIKISPPRHIDQLAGSLNTTWDYAKRRQRHLWVDGMQL